jgi:hypothetical protein
MKFSAFLIATLAGASYAFAPLTPSSFRANSAIRAAEEPPVDKTMRSVDDGTTHKLFDPTSGDHPAVIRNNNDGVWVSQVRSQISYPLYFSFRCYFLVGSQNDFECVSSEILCDALPYLVF